MLSFMCKCLRMEHLVSYSISGFIYFEVSQKKKDVIRLSLFTHFGECFGSNSGLVG